MIYLRQSTASQEVPLGYFVDSADGNSEEVSLSIANTDIKIWKTGATSLANKNSGGATHISNGIYYAVLDATDTDTIGPMVLFVHVSGALTVRLECCVLAAAVYDVMFGTTAPATTGNLGSSTIGTVTTLTGHTPQTGDAFRTALGMASANLDSQLDALPTNAELATALVAADDAVLAAIAALTIPTANQNADALLGRNIAGGSSTGRTVTSALRKIRNKVAIAAGTMTVYAEDDSTPDHTAAVTTAAGNPIDSVDPA